MTEKNKILTYYKHRFAPSEATVDDIDIRDIAHALSYMCRANGHFSHFYSVAQHSINCANEALARGFDNETALLCLLHDSAEAYISDITRPVKMTLPAYSLLERHIIKTILQKFRLTLTPERFNAVHEIDDTLLFLEFEKLADERLFEGDPKTIIECDYSERPFGEVEAEFLTLFEKLWS